MHYGAKSTQAARHGIRPRWSRRYTNYAAGLSRCWCSRARPTAWKRSAPGVGPQHNHAKFTLRGACSVGGRPILNGAKSAGAARCGIQARRPKPFERRAADLLWCSCGQASADAVGRSAPRVGPKHNHAKSALRGAHAPWAIGTYSTGQKAHGPPVTGSELSNHNLSKLVPPTYRGADAPEPWSTAWG